MNSVQVTCEWTSGNLILDLPADAAFMCKAMRRGTYEGARVKHFLSLLHPGMTLIDLGAYVGYYSLLGSRAVGAKGQVFAFEPDPNNRQFIELNVLRNRCQNIECVPQAAGDANQLDAAFYSMRQSSASSLLPPSSRRDTLLDASVDRQLNLSVVTLDTWLRERCIQRVDIIKIDVEGAELQALKGAASTLESHNVKLLVELHHRDDARVIDFLHERDYETSLITNDGLVPTDAGKMSRAREPTLFAQRPSFAQHRSERSFQ